MLRVLKEHKVFQMRFLNHSVNKLCFPKTRNMSALRF